MDIQQHLIDAYQVIKDLLSLGPGVPAILKISNTAAQLKNYLLEGEHETLHIGDGGCS